MLALKHGERLLAVLRGNRLIAVLFKGVFVKPPYMGVVVYHKYVEHGGCPPYRSKIAGEKSFPPHLF